MAGETFHMYLSLLYRTMFATAGLFGLEQIALESQDGFA